MLYRPSGLFASAAAPAWFHLAMQQALAPINERLDTVTERLDTVTERLDTVTERLDTMTERLDRLTNLATRTARSSAIVSSTPTVSIFIAKSSVSPLQSYNLQAGSGNTRSFEIVLFRDGSDPTSEEVSFNIPFHCFQC